MSEEEKKKPTLADRINDRREKMLKQNQDVWSYVDKGIKEGRILWGRVITEIISLVGIVIILVFWNPITTFLADGLKILLSGLSDPTSAPIVANWLLAILILATIGVVFIPFLSAGDTGPDSGWTVSPTTHIR